MVNDDRYIAYKNIFQNNEAELQGHDNGNHSIGTITITNSISSSKQ
jgi:hypothetical protein